MYRISSLVVLMLAVPAWAAEPVKPREALQPLQSLIGGWKGTGSPEGSREEKQKGFWTERSAWEWQFKGDDAWLKGTFERGKYFVNAELRALEKPNHFRLTVETTAKETLTFEGQLTGEPKRLVLERMDEKAKETQRVTVQLLHSNRVVWNYDVRPDGKTMFVKKYHVGNTKEGEAFAAGSSGPECIVSGGLGTMIVTYKGQTYHVCCSGCRNEFKENPEKYIKEYEAKKKNAK